MQGEAEKMWDTLFKEDYNGMPLRDVLIKTDLINNDITN